MPVRGLFGLGAAPGMPSDAWDAGQNALRNAKADADNGNTAQAVKGLSFALAQKNAMTASEQARFQTDYALAVAYVYKPRTAAQVAQARQNLAMRTKAQEDAVRAENARTGGVDPGGAWYSPAAWGINPPGTGPAGSSLSGKLIAVAGVGLGLYLFVKIINYMTAGRQVEAARYSTAQAALSRNPRRRRKKRR